MQWSKCFNFLGGDGVFPWRKKKGFGFFDDIADDFERMQEEMERMMEAAFSMKEGSGKEPFVYGFSVRVGPDGKPVVQQFGNVKQKFKGAGEEREPLVDVIEEKEKVSVIAEVPGVDKQDIKLKATENTLSIKVGGEERKYSKLVNLPCKVKPDSAKASYKNGVLEVTLERLEPKKETGKEIKIG